MSAASIAACRARVRAGIVATSSGKSGWPTCGVTVASWTPVRAIRSAWARLAAVVGRPVVDAGQQVQMQVEMCHLQRGWLRSARIA